MNVECPACAIGVEPGARPLGFGASLRAVAGAKDGDDPSEGLPRVGVEWDEESTADERKKLTRAIDTSKLLRQVGEPAPPPPGFFPQKRPPASAPKSASKPAAVAPVSRRQGLRVGRNAPREAKPAPSVSVPTFVDDESTADGHTQILRPDVELFIDEVSLTGDELAAIEAENGGPSSPPPPAGGRGKR